MADAAKLIDRAEKLLDKGKPELALAEFRSALELEPKNEALLHKTADLSMSHPTNKMDVQKGAAPFNAAPPVFGTVLFTR